MQSNANLDYKKFGTSNLHSIKSKELERIGSNKVEQVGSFFSDVLILGGANHLIVTSGTVPFLIQSIQQARIWSTI